ncbi:MAG: hypothetical protein AAGD14_01865, partial [Planctomycetota bacterium]
MRFDKARIALVVLALGAFLLPKPADAGWFSSDDEKKLTLEDVIRNPDDFKQKKFTITVTFNSVAKQFNPYFTEYHNESNGNFGAWTLDSRVYTKRDFQRCYPHFYVKKPSEQWEDVKDLERFDRVELTCTLQHVFQGRPYIEVLEVDEVSGGMDADEVKAAIRAQAHYLAGHYGRAVELYRRAITNDVPAVVRMDLYRRLGDAQFKAKQFADAKSSYKRAMRDAPDSAVLKQNIAASEQAYGRANGNQQSMIEPTRYIAHHLETVREDEGRGVDLVIAALEDPAKVAEMTRKENERLARRSVHGTEGPKTVVVSETKPVEEPMDEEPKEAAAGAEEEQPEEVMPEPEAAEPEAMDPEAAEPEATEPEVMEPEAMEPEATEPEATEPEATEPEVMEPEAEEPKTEETVEEPKAEETPAEEPKTEEIVEEPKAEETVEEPKTEETVEEPKTEEPVEEPKLDEPVMDEPKAEETPADEPTTEEIMEEPKAEETAEETTQEPMAEEPAQDESVSDENIDQESMEDAPALETDETMDVDDPRVLKVGNTSYVLPRLPFYGCALVTYEQYRAVVEEILDTEDDLPVEGMTDVAEQPAEPMPIEKMEPMPAENAVETPAEEQGGEKVEETKEELPAEAQPMDPEAKQVEEPEAKSEEPKVDDPW